MKSNLTILILGLAAITACNNKEAAYDASGTFEAVETIVSAEASGNIKTLDIEEGQVLKAGQVVAYIDSVQLILKKKQLQAQVSAVLSGRPDISAQTAALQEQLKQAERERDRTENLLKADAATRKQLDDAVSQVAIVKKQIAATQSSLGITTANLKDQTAPLEAQIQQIDDQLQKCRLTNPVDGTVLTKYAEAGEVTSPGKAIYKIAALNTIILRAYLTGDQLPHVKTGQQVKVLVDDTKDAYKTYTGTIEWISNKAEFTPKTIQTKDERANLVYAIKVRINNDGYLKIGMYGEVKL
ncbi:HlyD family secretion protein [Chitinophaga sancti]|uniref:HlyD family efflux transporter periplasmic adaptor subunit n=1 Tax=Chitinophaga sancti TaxID=1004 RepID=A0A1K1S3P0_9BACT|nr:HlyD family efflux transporter periplasmic adaptor subunit [Chitinophaga sancti]WQD63755.1 HlyD family efflux transporter periplasmic adaptor subunit [Chitinophaga sancti]WQG90620.1 HlyD family efflux transporter periplasmic adaptor subunit [Chitinophaga sancti]SFW79048.1 HlyD family secretion protein [Chitinophaga sancti]